MLDIGNVKYYFGFYGKVFMGLYGFKCFDIIFVFYYKRILKILFMFFNNRSGKI